MGMSDWKQDAQFVGAFIRGGNWEIGLRVARNVTPNEGEGGKKPASSGRISIRDFATEAGISKTTVSKYLAAWEWAADSGIVDYSADLSADDEYDWETAKLTQEDWASYYEVACNNPPPWNPDGKPLEPRKGINRHVSQDISDDAVVTAIKSKPELITEAVISDNSAGNKVAQAAIRGLNRKAKQEEAKLPQSKLTPKERALERKEREAFLDDLGQKFDKATAPVLLSSILDMLEEITGDLQEFAKAYSPNGIPQEYVDRISEALAGFNEELNMAKMSADRSSK